jgi:hypothetical protein
MITPLNVETAMQNHWRAIDGLQVGKGVLKGSDEDDDVELALSAFKGKCWVYKQKGHKAAKCPNNKKDKNKDYKDKNQGFTGTCNHCDRKRHKLDNCWLKPGNESKIPKWLKDKEKNNDKTEVAGAAVEKVE